MYILSNQHDHDTFGHMMIMFIIIIILIIARYVLVMAATFGAFLGPFSGVLMAAAVV